jgi:hypothetical protein
MVLLPVQAIALHEAITYGKLFGAIAPGLGKALLSLLLHVVLLSRKSVLLVPPTLREQTLHKVVPTMSKHWQIPSVGLPGSDAEIIVVTHSEVSVQKTADILLREAPALIVIDEAHAFARDSARGKRLFHYAGANPAVTVIPLSGSMIDPELEGASRLASLSLREGSPYPRTQDAVRLAVALDQGLTADAREFAGLLLPGKDLRASLKERVLLTPGVVVAPRNDYIKVPLVIKARHPKVPPGVTAALRKLRDEWTTPTGEEFSEAVEFHRHAMELAQGFCYRWVWPATGPDEAWLTARRDWHRVVRRKLLHATPGMDSEGLLRKAAASGAWKTPAYSPWAEVMDRKQPPTEAVWISDFLVRDAVKWGNEEPGIIWYPPGAVAFGRAVAAAGNFPLYDGDGSTPELIEKGDRSIVASWQSCGTGLELQMFHRMYLPRPSSNSRSTEQLLARCHRIGQTETVEVDICLHTPELRAALEAAQSEAKLLAESAPGAESQKLLYADVLT